MIDYQQRLDTARRHMAELGIDAMYLCPSSDAQYLTGIKREAPNPTHTHLRGDWIFGLWVTPTEAVFVVPEMISRFVIPEIEKKSFLTDHLTLNPPQAIETYAERLISRLDLTGGCLAVPKTALAKTIVNLSRLFPHMRFATTESFTAGMRMVKDATEVEKMRAAATLTDKIFADILPMLKSGMTELEVAVEIDFQIRRRGADGCSFHTGVMVKGPGKPNGIGGAGSTTLDKGCTLAFDFGLVLDGYCSDFGRTVYIGEPTDEMVFYHELVMSAQKAGIDAMKAGTITAEALNGVSREVIEAAGHGEKFFHRLGHGIGSDVHEFPFLDIGYTTILEQGMTFTIEPSIFIPEKLLIRVEDVVLVTREGGEPLNKATKEILVVA
ncbi:MAG: aminopeptidase P family protein [Desulfobacteraceae bacterium]|nr:aminopeptidase P family protein [Desulfobacteraceae bacterium]